MNDETLNRQAAADFLCIHEDTIIELAATGEIPHAAKIGRSWVFLKSGLIEYIKIKAAEQNKARRAGKIGNTKTAANDQTHLHTVSNKGGKRRTPPPLDDTLIHGHP